MSYGAANDNGLKLHIRGYADLIAAGTLTATQVATARAAADAHIDIYLAAIGGVLPANLPLANHACVDGISDLFTSCTLIRAFLTESDPNKNDNKQYLCDDAQDLLDALVKSPAAIIAAINTTTLVDTIQSSTLNQDRKFSYERTSGGNVVSGDSEGTMEGW